MKNVVIYGAGAVSRSVVRLLNPQKSNLVGIIDKNYKSISKYEMPEKGLWWDIPESWKVNVVSPEKISDMEYDYLLICNDFYQEEMKNTMLNLGVSSEKMISITSNNVDFDYRHFYMSLIYEKNISQAHKVLVELSDCEVFDYAVCRQLMVRRNRFIEGFQAHIHDDYVRISTLELLAARIKELGVEGNIAEAGVYRGDTAKHYNQFFPDRKLYLFDTFDSFNVEVMEKEKTGVSDSFVETFKNTSVELVLSKMKYPENCVIKKGVFPDSAEGLDNEKWAFVSLDMDLYESTYAGLKYFYPRLQKNGYLVIHDCLHHQEADGHNAMPAGKAVDRFCEEEGINYVPVTDTYGSVIITK